MSKEINILLKLSSFCKRLLIRNKYKIYPYKAYW